MVRRLAPDAIARRVRAEMAAQRRTHAALADALGVTAPKIRRRMSGEVEFSAIELVATADFLGVSVDFLLDDADSAAAGAA